MSHPRRQLARRGRMHRSQEFSSPVPHRQHEVEASQQSTELPEYQHPSCPLSTTQKRALEDLRDNYDNAKYKKHIGYSIVSITECATVGNDRLTLRKETIEKATEKRAKNEREKTEEDVEDEKYLGQLSRKIGQLTTAAEEALRELIDYQDEVAMQGNILRQVIDQIANAPAAQPRRVGRQRHSVRDNEDDTIGEPGEDEDEDEDAPAGDVETLSSVELFKKAQKQYETQWKSQSMRDRYDVNDYKNFKRSVHDAQYPADTAPPVPHASTWFKDGVQNTNDDDSDDEVETVSESKSLKCIFTLQYFKEPFTSKKCNHTFEKGPFLDFHNTSGTVFAQQSQRRRNQPLQGPKTVACPQAGCNQMLEPKDFYLDPVVMRQVGRAKKAEEGGNEDNEDDEDELPRGTQRSRPQEVDENNDYDDDMEMEEDGIAMIDRVKRENQRGIDLVPQMSSGPDMDTVMQE